MIQNISQQKTVYEQIQAIQMSDGKDGISSKKEVDAILKFTENVDLNKNNTDAVHLYNALLEARHFETNVVENNDNDNRDNSISSIDKALVKILEFMLEHNMVKQEIADKMINKLKN